MPQTKTIAKRNISYINVPLSIELRSKVDEMVKDSGLTLADFLRYTLEGSYQRQQQLKVLK